MLQCVKFQAPNSKFQFKRRLALYFCWDLDFVIWDLNFEFAKKRRSKGVYKGLGLESVLILG